jgi:hypothetical protein
MLFPISDVSIDESMFGECSIYPKYSRSVSNVVIIELQASMLSMSLNRFRSILGYSHRRRRSDVSEVRVNFLSV